MKKALYSGLAALFIFSASCSGIPSKKWVEDRVNNAVIEYKEKDRQWTENRFKVKLDLKQVQAAFDSTYYVFKDNHYKFTNPTINENQTFPYPTSGSGVLLNGGYLLSANHVIEEEDLEHPLYGIAKIDHSRTYLRKDVRGPASLKEYDLEKIISGSKEEIDYVLLKVKDAEGLPFYANGLNIPDKQGDDLLNMQSIVIGFPLGWGKNLRSGNVSQIDSDLGEYYLGFKNNLYKSDSGGPIFILEDGNVKLAAISTAIMEDPETGAALNINYGLKIRILIEDMESQLKSGKLDDKTTQEVENFLKLNRK